MNRFQQLFEDKNKKAFVPFFMLGDPNAEDSFELIKAAIDAGADALELGLPFSDPIADGPVIQASAERAIAQGVDIDVCMDIIKKIREYSNVPIGLLIYYNLLFHQAGEDAYIAMKAAGVDGVLVVDLPIEESEAHEALLKRHDIGCIQLIALNTPEARAKEILSRVTAFAYVVSRFGTTGVRDTFEEGVYDRLNELKQWSDCALVVGFGVNKAEHVESIFNAGAQGAIIGSAITKLIAENCDTLPAAKTAVTALVADCVQKGAK